MFRRIFVIPLLLLGGTECSNESDLQHKSNLPNVSEKKEEGVMEEMKIKLSVHNEELIVKMNDNSTSRDFLELLPLTLTFKDYARKEKVSNPPRQLSEEGAPSGIEPRVGDVTYYAPWGNLAIFYEDFSYSSGLIKLGEVESGLESIPKLQGEVRVERLE
ncbi:cyclophilin-like fold protein [Priestia flexa]|uniref:cyclophilin-like fold protein n=1 Tax=Priestia flexa TaxID=86664 RepID=UPI0032ED254C